MPFDGALLMESENNVVIDKLYSDIARRFATEYGGEPAGVCRAVPLFGHFSAHKDGYRSPVYQRVQSHLLTHVSQTINSFEGMSKRQKRDTLFCITSDHGGRIVDTPTTLETDSPVVGFVSLPNCPLPLVDDPLAAYNEDFVAVFSSYCDPLRADPGYNAESNALVAAADGLRYWALPKEVRTQSFPTYGVPDRLIFPMDGRMFRRLGRFGHPLVAGAHGAGVIEKDKPGSALSGTAEKILGPAPMVSGGVQLNPDEQLVPLVVGMTKKLPVTAEELVRQVKTQSNIVSILWQAV